MPAFKTKHLCTILCTILTTPLFAQDSDGDGASDSFEIATGFNPNNSASTPPATSAIGINFRRNIDPIERTSWLPDQVNGYIPQVNWNQCATHGNESLADQSRIESPIAGTTVNAAGEATTLTFSSTNFFFASNNPIERGFPERLNAGYLLNRGDPVNVQVNQVPYNNYDVYVYVSGASNLAINEITLNKGTATEESRIVRPTNSRTPEGGFFPERKVPAEVRQHANVVHFRNLSEPDFNIQIDDLFAAVAFAALQVVDRNADSDGDEIPDWWEHLHRTDSSTANPNDDLDNDLLGNLDEFRRDSDPNDPDSDDDGLSDLTETGTGTFVDLTNTGTDPVSADSDGDLLGDYAEIYDINPSDPNKVDTDGDGLSDREEHRSGSSARFSNAHPTDFIVPEPTIATNSEFQWEIPNLQIHWKHRKAPSGGDWLFNVGLRNDTNHPFPRLFAPQIRFGLHGSIDSTINLRLDINSNQTWNSDRRIGFRIRSNDLREACGFSGHGDFDFSDILTFTMNGERNPDDSWTLTWTLFNQSTNEEIFRHVDDTASANSTINDGTAIWLTNLPEQSNNPPFTTGSADVYISDKRLDRNPIFIDSLDSNNDGIADAWASSFGITTAGDDPDGDGLSNLEEFEASTNPTLKDSDNDGVHDKLELSSFTNANDPTSIPYFARTAAPSGSDLNGNGLPDLWESHFTRGLSLIASEDPDGDGFTNRQEAVAGTDPFNASSLLALLMRREEGGLALAWDSHPDKITHLQGSDSLDDFDNILDASSGMIISVEEKSSTFFRLTREDRDRDNDGLTDADERFLGTDPTQRDSSGRAVQQDLDSDGVPETSISADYARFLERYQNRGEINELNKQGGMSPREASRFLMQATFGPIATDIEKLRSMGIESWITNQIHAQPISKYRPMADAFYNDINGPQLHTGLFITNRSDVNPAFLSPSNINTIFAESAIKGTDQLRQRAALALSQFFVISRVGNSGISNVQLVSQYYDLLAENAFGNFFDLLKKVTFTFQMSNYLSSIENQKEDPTINRFPDENFAREVMQLFTIGIHELNNDGIPKRNEQGQLIETYDQDDVVEMARVMTGFRAQFKDLDDFFGSGTPFLPVTMVPTRHDFEEKLILKRHTIPAREETIENGFQDVEDALRVLFEHENTPPFIAKSFIQFFVTDNPSPDFVERVANTFIDDGTGERGNMEALFKAILLDPEARDLAIADSRKEFGRLRDPLVRLMHLGRLLHMEKHETIYWWSPNNRHADRTGQEIFASPTVFNFYNPSHKPNGPLSEADLVGAPFEILDSITAVTFPNFMWDVITRGFQQPERVNQDGYDLQPSYEEFLPYAGDNEALTDQLDLLFCGGRMKLSSRRVILEALAHSRFENGLRPVEKIQLALYLTAISPESAIMR